MSGTLERIEQPSLPRGLPADPLYTAAALSPGAWLLCTLVHWWLIWLTTTDFGRHAVGVNPHHVIAVNVVCEFFHAVNVWVIGPKRILEPELAWYRGFSYVVMLPTLIVYGAGSSLDLSPAWIVALDAPLLFARATPGSPFLAGLLALSPLLLRLALVPDSTAISLLLAVAIGLVSWLIYTRRSRGALELLRLRSQRQAEAELTEEAVRREAALDVAMSLHDGLSGALFAARQRVAAALEPEQALMHARGFALHARGVLYGIQGRSTELRNLEDVAEALDGFARLLLVETKLVVLERGQAETEELRDLRDIALELMSNAVRHGRANHLALRLAVGPERLELECKSSGRAENDFPMTDSGARASSGRGLRNIELRLRARGGSLSSTSGEQRWEVSVSWPRAAERDTPSYLSRLWPEFPASLLASGFLAFANTSVASLVCVAANVPFLTWVTFAMERSVTRAQARLRDERRARRAAEATPNLGLVDRALTEPLAELETEVVSGEVDRCRAALGNLATIVGDLLWSLEWEGDAFELEAELVASYRVRRADLGAITPELAADVAARFDFRRLARSLSVPNARIACS